jgi:hypothetical protein
MSIVLGGDGTITGLTATGISAVQQLPAGSVIQTVYASSTSGVSTSSTSYVTTNFSTSITPKFSTSKILVMFAGQAFMDTKGVHAYISIYRGGSAVYSSSVLLINSAAATSAIGGTPTLIYQDSPATTSSTTYTMYYKTGGSGTFYLDGEGSSPYSLTLMEIAA